MCFDLLWGSTGTRRVNRLGMIGSSKQSSECAATGKIQKAALKGFQANADASFRRLRGMQFEPPEQSIDHGTKVQWIHTYADGVKSQWLIPNVIPSQRYRHDLRGKRGYKSFLALDMASCLGFGIPGQWNAPPVKNDVLFLAGEGPVAMAKKRWPRGWNGKIQFATIIGFDQDRVPLYTRGRGRLGECES